MSWKCTRKDKTCRQRASKTETERERESKRVNAREHKWGEGPFWRCARAAGDTAVALCIGETKTEQRTSTDRQTVKESERERESLRKRERVDGAGHRAKANGAMTLMGAILHVDDGKQM